MSGSTHTPQSTAQGTTPTPRQLNVMRHSLGLNDQGAGRRYRNHFCTGPGSKDYDDCEAMVAAGYMRLVRGPHPLSGGDNTYAVTPEGIAVVESAKVPDTKLTEKQKRYREYLAADSGLPFGEWLKATISGISAPDATVAADDFLERAADIGSNDQEIELLQEAVRTLMGLLPGSRVQQAADKLNELFDG